MQCACLYIHPNTQQLSKQGASLLLNTQSYNCLWRRWLALAGFYLGWACTQIADSTTNSRKRAGPTKQDTTWAHPVNQNPYMYERWSRLFPLHVTKSTYTTQLTMPTLHSNVLCMRPTQLISAVVSLYLVSNVHCNPRRVYDNGTVEVRHYTHHQKSWSTYHYLHCIGQCVIGIRNCDATSIYVNISERNGSWALWTISSPNTFTLGKFHSKPFPSALTQLNLLSGNQSLCGKEQAKGDGRHPN